jgi:hypothetical protein
LARLFAKFANTKIAIVKQKQQLPFFQGLLQKLRVQTVVIERDYTDRDFLEDYAAHYVRCLNKYHSRCVRLHFFSSAFDLKGFRRTALGEGGGPGSATLRNTYQGFVVVKPLPKTFIGRTCLRPPAKASHGRGSDFTLRRYDAHLAGLDLSVDSLAFQEQDETTAACATSALWSVFHATGSLFGHKVDCPVEITRHATEKVPGLIRSFPNGGLQIGQMAAAIRRAGLDPEAIGVEDKQILQDAALAYLRAKIPLILNGRLYRETSIGVLDLLDTNPDISHAVALTGFSLRRIAPVPDPKSGILRRSSQMDKLFVHDDQVGPFAPLRFVDPGRYTLSQDAQKATGTAKVPRTLTKTLWKHGSDTILFAPDSIVLPLYHKIRIPYEAVSVVVSEVDAVIEHARKRVRDLRSRVVWEVYLTSTVDLKADLRTQRSVARDIRIARLETPMPRFIWRAIGWHEKTRLLELLFDATDIVQGDYLIGGIEYRRGIFKTLLRR